MAAYPQLLREAFEPKQKITSDYIQNLFVTNFSSDRRMQEEAIMMLWIRYLKVNIDCYHVSVIPYTVCPEEGSPTLKDVMIFLTGCDSVPPLGQQA